MGKTQKKDHCLIVGGAKHSRCGKSLSRQFILKPPKICQDRLGTSSGKVKQKNDVSAGAASPRNMVSTVIAYNTTFGSALRRGRWKLLLNVPTTFAAYYPPPVRFSHIFCAVLYDK